MKDGNQQQKHATADKFIFHAQGEMEFHQILSAHPLAKMFFYGLEHLCSPKISILAVCYEVLTAAR
jgi:hypothetical protein